MKDNSRLSVLQVCSASQAVYGAVQSLLTLARTQRDAGTHVEFLTFKGKKFGQQVRDFGFTVHETRVRSKIDPIAILRMRQIIRHGQYDVVHTHLSTSSVNGCLAAKVAKVPCIATVHGMSGKLSFAAADHLIAVSGEVKNHLVSQGVSPAKISVVHNGLELGFPMSNRAEARASLGISSDEILLGTVSRVTAMKGIDDGIQAFASLRRSHPNLRYVVVGDGDALESCKELAATLGVAADVQFVGYQTEVGKYLPGMDIFVFPTHKEAMGLALVEAMAAGLPSVAASVGGVPEVVTSSTGILVPAKDPEALAKATESLVDDPKRRHAMGTEARNRAVESFSAESMRRGTEAVYRGLLSGAFSSTQTSAPGVRSSK
jgi:glycosyltransferase involved in cell wall biosynthesis